MAKAKTAMPEWLREMEDVLECPVCLKTIMDPPIFMCENSHMLCEECRGQLKNDGKPCPVCNGALTNKRMLPVEKMLDKLPKEQCKFNECNFARASIGFVEEHEKDCKHRLVPCYTCNKKVPLSGKTEHVITKHSSILQTEKMNEWRKTWYWPLSKSAQYAGYTPITRDDDQGNKANFFFTVVLDDSRYLAWVCHDLSKSDQQSYRYHINLLCGKADDNKETLVLAKHSAFCRPSDISLATIKKELFGLVVHEDIMKDAANNKNEFRFELCISKCN